ncbi:SpoIIE family protein phosphatase [Anaerolineales bacterium HSG25]|nr:SpoIIE family protein phosphatase [Anaerolineales bacterium HSG25]
MAKKILIVEDDPALGELINYQIEAEGYQTTWVTNGRVGLETAQQGLPPDLVVLDVQLPGLNGFEVCQALQETPSTATIPIIFLTARATMDDKLSGFDAGAVDYMTKPFRSAELIARIKAILTQSERKRQQGLDEAKFEMSQAVEIQRRLMPNQPPTVPTLDLSAQSRPAKQIGGDFYDFLFRPDKQLVFIEGDVTGKGLPAALIMSSTLTALWGASHYLETPQEVLERANLDLYGKLTEVRKFVTAFVGAYNSETRQLTYANAGHSLVIHVPLGQAGVILEADGPPIGVLPTMLSNNQQLTLNPGDLFVVASDGFFEAENPAGEMLGHKQFIKLIEKSAPHSAEEIVISLFNQITDFTAGQPQADDQTLIVLKGEAT